VEQFLPDSVIRGVACCRGRKASADDLLYLLVEWHF
jgi:hypothetical protein